MVFYVAGAKIKETNEEFMKHVMIILMTMILGFVHGQTLDDYLKMAADSNAMLKASFYQYYAALEKVNQPGLPDPELGFGYFINPVETRLGPQQAKFSVMQMFPWFGTISAQRSMMADRARVKFEEFNAHKSELFLELKQNYYQLEKLKSDQELLKEHLEILDLYKALANTKVESGSGSVVDVLRIDMESADIDNVLIGISEKQDALKVKFNQLLNRDPVEVVVLPDSMLAVDIRFSVSELTDSILSGNDQLHKLEAMIEASGAQVEVAKKMGGPSFGLGINYFLINERTDANPPDNGKDALMPMLSVKLPVYRRKYKGMVREAEFNSLAFQEMHTDQVNMLLAKIEMLLAEYRDAERRINLYQEQIDRAMNAREILVEAYSVSGKDFEEILRIQRLLLKYEQNIVTAVRDKNIAVAKLEALY